MFETEEDRLLFSSLIKINYDQRFVRIVQDFIENLSLLAGANKEESLRFSWLPYLHPLPCQRIWKGY